MTTQRQFTHRNPRPAGRRAASTGAAGAAAGNAGRQGHRAVCPTTSRTLRICCDGSRPSSASGTTSPAPLEHNKGGWQWPARIEDLQRTAQEHRRGDTRHSGMRVLHRVQCARRNGNRTAGHPVHRADHPALREPGPRHVPHARRPGVRPRDYRAPHHHVDRR